jgi:fructokinase
MRIGIDLGGTKTEIICLHRKNGKELYRQRVPSPKDDYEATIKNIVQLINAAEENIKEEGTVGIGIPGTVSSVTGLVKNANSTWINGNPLDKDLGEALGRSVKVQNDANCFTVSEATDGAAAGKQSVFGVIIGTGCGAGIVVNGEIQSGINGISGEWGHNPLPYPKAFDPSYRSDGKNEEVEYFTSEEKLSECPGPKCYCGRYGCLETYISGTGFKADYKRVNNNSISTHDIIEMANNGDEKATEALNRYIDRLARGLAGVINILDPEVIVLGGGMSNVSQLYKEVPKVWGKYIFSDTVDTKLLEPRFGDSSGVRGAAWLWNNNNEQI